MSIICVTICRGELLSKRSGNEKAGQLPAFHQVYYSGLVTQVCFQHFATRGVA